MPIIGLDGNCLFLARRMEGNKLGDVRLYIDAKGIWTSAHPEAYLTEGGRNLRGAGHDALVKERDKPFGIYEITEKQYRRILGSNAVGMAKTQYDRILDVVGRARDTCRTEKSA